MRLIQGVESHLTAGEIEMVNKTKHASTILKTSVTSVSGRGDGRAAGSLAADIIIANAPDPVFVSDLEGKILQANEAVFGLLGFRPDEVIEQSLSRFISPEETREFTAALREVVEKGAARATAARSRARDFSM